MYYGIMEKNHNQFIIFTTLMYSRILYDIKFIENKINKLKISVTQNQDNVINLNFFSNLELSSLNEECDSKKALLEKIEKTLTDIGYSPKDISNFNSLFKQEFSDNSSLYFKIPFLIQFVSYPLYAENNKIKYKEHTKLESFERISIMFGFYSSILSEMEREIKSSLKDLSPQFSDMAWILGIAAILMFTLPMISFAITSNVGIYSLSGSKIMHGLASIGVAAASITGIAAPSILGVSILGIGSIATSYTSVKLVEEIFSKKYKSLSILKTDQLRYEGVHFLVTNHFYKKFENTDFEIKKIRKAIIKAFLDDKSEFETNLLLKEKVEMVEVEKAEMISKITILALKDG